MPGPVSDSYDPEFGTAANAYDVREAVTQLRDRVSDAIGDEQLKNILTVVHGAAGPHKSLVVATNERELRILRFALNRALDSI